MLYAAVRLPGHMDLSQFAWTLLIASKLNSKRFLLLSQYLIIIPTSEENSQHIHESRAFSSISGRYMSI